jgi:CheY-like chemotaxis protein
VLITGAPPADDSTLDEYRLDDLQPAKILYADDEPMNRELMKSYFEDTQHQLFLAENGLEAVEMTDREQPDLILMDIRMPVMDGVEATKIVKAKHSIPVIVLTASSMRQQQARFEEICDQHLNKPISLSELANALRSFLPIREEVTAVLRETEDPRLEGSAEDEAGFRPEDISRWPQLLDLLQSEMQGDWNKHWETPNMDEAEALADQLKAWGEEYKSRELMNYADRLKRQVEEFDIENLPQTLFGFSDLIKSLAGKILRS